MILTVGEALMEFRRADDDGAIAPPGTWHGPFPSGAPAIFASVAARLGAPVTLAATVGLDVFGDRILERLRRDGVRVEGITRSRSRATAVAFVAYDAQGGRDFWFSVPNSAAMDISPQHVAALAADADWLHVSGSTLGFGGAPAAAIEAAATVVLGNGGRLSVDPNVRSDAYPAVRALTERLVRRATVVLPSAGELATLGLHADELAASGSLVCETHGAAGARLWLRDAVVDVPVEPQDERDATGAGDTFAAAFVAALRRGVAPAEAAEAAAALAAQSVRVLGAMELPIAGRG